MHTFLLALCLACTSDDVIEDTASPVEDTGSRSDTHDTDSDTDSETEPTPDLANGQTVHDEVCIGCHYGGPSFAEVVPTLSDEQISVQVREGGGYMPAQDLGAAELTDVIAFLRATYDP